MRSVHVRLQVSADDRGIGTQGLELQVIVSHPVGVASVFNQRHRPIAIFILTSAVVSGLAF